MANLRDRDTRENIQKLVNAILRTPKSQITQTRKLGQSHALREAGDVFDKIKEKTRVLNSPIMETNLISSASLDGIVAPLANIVHLISNVIPAYKMTDGPTGERSLTRRLIAAYRDLNRPLQQIESFALGMSRESIERERQKYLAETRTQENLETSKKHEKLLENMREELRRDKERYERVFRKQQKQAEDLKKSAATEVSALLKPLRKESAKATTREEADHFQDVKNQYRKRANWWLWWSIAAAVINIAAAIVMFLAPAMINAWFQEIGLIDNTNAAYTWNLLTTKFFVLAITAYLFYTSVRTFLAVRHNFVINEQREKALATYKTMVSITGTERARDIVLTLAASAIYSPQDTGFAKSNVGGSQTQIPIANQILAATREAGTKGGD